MTAALVCMKMNWTWQEYKKQPTWFIDILCGFFMQEAAHKKKSK